MLTNYGRQWKAEFDHARRPKCTVCNAENPNHCARCQSASYFSPECQKKDWPVHKTLCKGYKPFLTTKPNDHHSIGIMLPADSSKPRLIWFEHEVKVSHNEIAGDDIIMTFSMIPKLRPLLNVTEKDPEEFLLTTDHNLMGKFELPYQLQATACDLQTQTKPNKCVEHLLGVMPAAFWKGPIILTRQHIMRGASGVEGEGSGVSPIDVQGALISMGESVQIEDMTLADLSHAMGLLEAAPVADLEADGG